MNWPLLDVAIEPRSPEAREGIAGTLEKLASVDPTFCYGPDGESGQFLLGGASEDQLASCISALRHEFGDAFLVGAPQVAYRERLGRAATIDYSHKSQTGGSGEFARVKIEFEPGEPGSGLVFENKIVGGVVPKDYIPGVEKGLNLSKENGLLAGFPVIEVEARLVDGAYHDIDSDARTFQIAAQAAFRKLKDDADPRIAEPVMKLEILTPSRFGDAIGQDLEMRRASVQSREARAELIALGALVPLANLFGYSNALRALADGEASYSMAFSHYQDLPRPDDDPTFSLAMRA